LSREGLVGSLFYPEDGRGNATDTTMSLARGVATLPNPRGRNC